MMRIYAVADIHAGPGRIDHLRTIVAAHQPDVVVAAGDIISYIHAKNTLAELNELPVPVVCVRGNSDPRYVEKYFHRFSNLTPLHLNRVTLQAIPFTGISGTIPLPFYNRVGFFENRLQERVAPLIDSSTVLVAHTPPRGTLDRVMGRFHSGSTLLRDLVELKQPCLLICGHIHEDAGTGKIGRTVVVNCSMPITGKGMLISLKQGSEPRVKTV